MPLRKSPKVTAGGNFLDIEVICWVMLLLTLSVVLIVRLRLLGIPLERDEGEYAYLGQLLLQGVPPYKLAYSMKLPGACAVYALLMAVFGETIKGIHLGFLIINFASIALIFFIAKRLSGTLAGIISAAAYAVLSVSQSVLGVQAHATHLIVLAALCGSILLLKAVENDRKSLIFLSGLFFGLAFLMKQQGIFFIPFGIFYLSWACKKRSVLAANLMVYSLGAALPFALTCLVLFFAGVFDKFWFWTFQYASGYSSGAHVYLAFQIFKAQLLGAIKPFKPVWYIAAAGSLCLFIDAKVRKNIFFVAALLISSFLALCPGFIFREHYFVMILPVVSILCGMCVNSAVEFIKNRKYPAAFQSFPVIIFTVILALSVFQQRDYFFTATPERVSRKAYAENPFIESISIGNYLKAHSSPEDTIAVLGSEPQIYFYARRRSATGYIYAYPLMENQPYALKMQEEMIREIEFQKPLYLVFVKVNTSWLRHGGSENFIFRWAQNYITEHYDIAGATFISKQPFSSVLVYKRKAETVSNL
ncbi:MAG: glycosyltransferase family 39 protein [Candidatus Omnitrophota bacterium]|nr:glycosyltransferase family 39 protein [Candidatus Omnitrophota bacterium]